MNPRSATLPDLTWRQAQAAFERGAVALLPIGATEAHGPHLPLWTDVYLSLELCERVAAALAPAREALVVAPIPFALTQCAAPFAGTVTLRESTAHALFSDVLDSLERSGARTVALVNSHLEPGHRALLSTLRDRPGPLRVVFADHCRKPWALELGDEFTGGDCHAGAYETSLLLASRFAPQVRADVAAALPPARLGLLQQLRAGRRDFVEMGATDGYFGEPATASRDQGEQLFGVLVRMWVEAIELAGAS